MGGRTVYQAAYFTAFSPSNALELVQRVPGFSLELGSQDVRGFGQAAGNVVINGQRPSSKSDTLETILARIPASRVARVEVGSGDLFGSEFSGKPQVLNLILTAEGGVAGTATATLRRDFSGQLTPEGNVSALYRRGASSFNVSAGYNNGHFPEEGSDTITAVPGGALVEFRRKYNDTSEREAFLTGSWEHNGGPNRTAHANFRVADARFTLFQTNNVFPASGVERDDRLSQEQDRRDYEIGADITRPFLSG
ncbi:MAG TPA: TonB-dependent receptor, partial [Allosphingosinicella sp.]